MELTNFRVQMYKSVLDSGPISVENLTVLVGKNESGKTTLLRALQKFNPFKPDPFSISREWPRGHRDEQTQDQIVCTAEFRLSAEEIGRLKEITTESIDFDRVSFTRDYAGRLELLFPGGRFPEKLHPNEIDKICASIPEPPEDLGNEFKTAAKSCRDEAVRLAKEGRFSELAGLSQKQQPRLQMRSAQNPQQQNETNYFNSYVAKLAEAVAKLNVASTIKQKAHGFLVSKLPTFVYMDEYQTFQGMALLDQVKQRKDQNQLRPEDTTFLTILSLAELDIDEESKKATLQDREERQYDLSDAAATLSSKIEKHWKQLRYEVDFRADGVQFMTFVKGLKDKALIRLEERSKGFQWFFSFDLMLMHETKGSLKDCVILLDEPGLHLHPEAQIDLLDRLEEYAKGNTLIYTTHLPFMIDLQHPERIRVLSETEKGTVVTEDLTQSQPEAKLVLQAALGISGRASFLVSEQNLVVEGVDDYWIINELSNLFRRSNQEGLPADLMITAAGGASEVTYIATFMAGQELDVVALYDTDKAGETAKDKLVKKWLTRYSKGKATALSLGPTVGVQNREFSIEDLFPEDFYKERVWRAYEKVLIAAGSDKKAPLPPGEQNAKRFEALFEKYGLKFNKGTVSKLIRDDLRALDKIDKLPAETVTKARSLIDAIRKSLSR
jgi:predicted ATP-dependent endonuclease of OLD family